MTDDRNELRQRGQQVKEQLQHGMVPPRDRPVAVLGLPGMQAYVDEALFGSLWARPGLDFETRCNVVLAALMSLGQWPQLRTYLHSSLNAGLSVRAVQETLIQCAPFCGFPSLVNAMQAFNDALDARGLEPDLTPIDELDLPALESLGRSFHTELFGAAPATGATAAQQAVIDVEVRYVFGAMFHRPGLDRRTRLLIAVTCLACTGELVELERWSKAAIRAGLNPDEIGEAIAQCAYYAGFPKVNAALATIRPQRPS